MAYLDKKGLSSFFTGLKDLFLLKANVANNLTTTAAGKALDARQGKTLKTLADSKIGMTTASVTLAVASWSSLKQTVSVSGVTSSSTVIVTAAPASYVNYSNCMVRCSAQGSGTLTFTAAETPTAALTVNVLILK